MKVQRIENETWEQKVKNGVDEEGNNTYEVIRGDSEEELREKVKEYRRKKAFDRQNKWQYANKERISVVLDKGTRERIERCGESVNGFVKMAVEKELKSRGV